MMDEPTAATDVKTHIIALGRNPIDILSGDAHQTRQVRSPEFLEPLGCLARRRLVRALFEVRTGAVERPLEPGRINRLHQIVDGLTSNAATANWSKAVTNTTA